MKTLPLNAWLLGYAGVIPFLLLFLVISLDTAILTVDEGQAGSWLLAYAAVILSFLGAVHWGVALTASNNVPPVRVRRLFTYSVLPSLFAWLALLLPLKLAFFTMMLLVVLAYFADKFLLFSLIDSQYQKLRLHLTVAVSSLLFVTGLTVS